MNDLWNSLNKWYLWNSINHLWNYFNQLDRELHISFIEFHKCHSIMEFCMEGQSGQKGHLLILINHLSILIKSFINIRKCSFCPLWPSIILYKSFIHVIP